MKSGKLLQVKARPFPRRDLIKRGPKIPARTRFIHAAAGDPERPIEVELPQKPAYLLEVSLTVNGQRHTVQVRSHTTLVQLLREELGLRGCKVGCDDGTCGTCTVLMDGLPVYSCMVLAADVDGKSIMTIEGLGDLEHPHPLQAAFAESYAAQCGFCTPGFVMAAKALLDCNPAPSIDEVKEALSGNLCRCGYAKIVEAVRKAAKNA